MDDIDGLDGLEKDNQPIFDDNTKDTDDINETDQILGSDKVLFIFSLLIDIIYTFCMFNGTLLISRMNIRVVVMDHVEESQIRNS